MEENKVSSKSMSTYAEYQNKRAFLLLCVSNKESPRKAPEEFLYKEEK
jgi:hypothetical protein